MTFSQSPAWGTEQERTRALECLSGAEVRRMSKAPHSDSESQQTMHNAKLSVPTFILLSTNNLLGTRIRSK